MFCKNPAAASHEYAIKWLNEPALASYDAIIVVAGPQQLAGLGGAGTREFGKPQHILCGVR